LNRNPSSALPRMSAMNKEPQPGDRAGSPAARTISRQSRPLRWGRRIQRTALRLLARLKLPKATSLVIGAILVGVATGLGSVAFIRVLEFSTRLFFDGGRWLCSRRQPLWSSVQSWSASLPAWALSPSSGFSSFLPACSSMVAVGSSPVPDNIIFFSFQPSGA